MSKYYSVHIYLFHTADVEGAEGGRVINNKDKSISPDKSQPVKDAPESEWTECNFSYAFHICNFFLIQKIFNRRIHCKNLQKYFYLLSFQILSHNFSYTFHICNVFLDPENFKYATPL